MGCCCRVRRRRGGTGSPVEPGRHLPRGPGTQPCPGELRCCGRHLASVGVIASGLPTDRPERRTARLDISGARTVTGGPLLLVYALARGADCGWTSATPLLPFA